MRRTLFTRSLALAVAAAFPTAARALDDVECLSGEIAQVKTYLSEDDAFGDTRANANGRIRLRGWVYVPSGTPPAGGFPVVVFNHGSEDTPGAKCEFSREFVINRRFVLFVPIRRGHTGSTGRYFADYADERTEEFCAIVPCTPQVRQQIKRIYTVDYLKEQRQDVADAIAHIKGYPKVNPHRIAVMGHSFGGIVSLFFNMLEGDDTKAVVDISGGAQSWGQTDPGDYLQQQMKDAVDHATRPIFFMSPMNDASRLPTIELAYRAGLRNMRWQAAIFPNVPDELLVCNDTGEACPCDDPDVEGPDLLRSCNDVAHGKFVSDPTQVQKWAPAVFEFLRRMGVR
jgi:pimeloyl-ACP methyl ester carboxylesterase